MCFLGWRGCEVSSPFLYKKPTHLHRQVGIMKRIKFFMIWKLLVFRCKYTYIILNTQIFHKKNPPIFTDKWSNIR